MVGVVDVVDQDLGLSSRTFLTYFFDLVYSVEAQLDYWREDPMLHAFHCILHSAWSQFSHLTSTYLASSGKHRKLLKEINSRENMRRFGFPMLSS